jgi:hypothetical protein
MGLVEAYGPGLALAGAYFADARCREVQLWFFASTDVDAGERMGPWRVSESGPTACGNAVLGNARCIDYHAPVKGGQIAVQMMGIPRDQGDRIVRSIPV